MKNLTKKTLSTILAAASMATVFAGCGSKEVKNSRRSSDEDDDEPKQTIEMNDDEEEEELDDEFDYEDEEDDEDEEEDTYEDGHYHVIQSGYAWDRVGTNYYYCFENDYEYDENNVLISKNYWETDSFHAETEEEIMDRLNDFLEAIEEGEEKRYYWTSYQYDESDNLIKETDHFSNGSTSITYTYDESNRLIKAMHYNGDGSLSYWYEFEYDEADRAVKKTEYYGFDSKTLAYYYLDYDSSDRLIREQEDYLANSDISVTKEYFYDESNRLIKEIDYNYSRVVGVSEYEYT